jgi:molybdopterin-guanine dinucleotide biosynthesis protein A
MPLNTVFQPQQNQSIDCLGIVLAGGLSSRMGENKAFLNINEQTMLSHSKNLLTQTGISHVQVSGANSGGEADIIEQGGPLAGIYTLIQRYQPKAILAMPVDMPFMQSSLLKELKLKGELSGKGTFFSNSSLPVYLPVNALLFDYLQQAFTSSKFLETGKGPSFKQVFSLTNALEISIKDKQTLTNTNTPEQWQHALALIKKTRCSYV